MPDLPRCRLVIANVVFEHLHDPVGTFRCLDAALEPGGFLLTNVADHQSEFMHVSPDLGALRQCIAQRRYVELKQNVLFRSEENTYELQSLMSISHAVFFLKQKNYKHKHTFTTEKQ